MGDTGEMGDAAGQQEALRRMLGEMMRRLGEGLGDIPEPFGRAERSMRDAAGALGRGRPGEAIGPQTDALDQLQQAARDLAQQMQNQLGSGWGKPDGESRSDRPQPGATGSSAIRWAGRSRTTALTIAATSKSRTKTSCRNRAASSMNCAAAPASVLDRRLNSTI